MLAALASIQHVSLRHGFYFYFFFADICKVNGESGAQQLGVDMDNKEG